MPFQQTISGSSYEVLAEYVAVNPNTGLVYVSVSDSIRVVDGSTNREVGRIDIDAVPYNLELNPKTNLLYVENGNSEGDRISVIDVSGKDHRIITNIDVSANRGMTINPETETLYVASADFFALVSEESNGSISVIDTKSTLSKTR